MSNMNGNIDNIEKLIDQAEIQEAKRNMNSNAGQNMILGAKLTPNASFSASQGNMMMNSMNSVPSLNSSLSVGSKEMQNAKNEVQKSGNNKELF